MDLSYENNNIQARQTSTTTQPTRASMRVVSWRAYKISCVVVHHKIYLLQKIVGGGKKLKEVKQLIIKYITKSTHENIDTNKKKREAGEGAKTTNKM